MSDEVNTVRISHKNAAFLQANLSALAITTRQAMSRPGLEMERRSALASRALLLETIDDAVRSALLDTQQDKRKTVRKVEIAGRTEDPRFLRNFGRLSAA
jgi:hypothetical protein